MCSVYTCTRLTTFLLGENMITNAREVAVEVLGKVLNQGAY